MENMIIRIDNLTANTVRDQNRILRKALLQAFLFIAHDQANRNKLTDDLQWDSNVREFLSDPTPELSIGRSNPPKAVLEVTKIKTLLTTPDPDDAKERTLLEALMTLDENDMEQIRVSDDDTRMHLLARLLRLTDMLVTNPSVG
jgi:hypothetical protein